MIARMIRPFLVGFCDHLQAHLQETDHGQLSGPEGPGVPEIPWQTGPDARRERAGEVRRLRSVRGRVPGRCDLPRSRRRTTAPSRRGRATRRSTRSTRRAASSAATAKRPARCRRSSWARTTSSRSTATRTSSGTRPICSSRRPRPQMRQWMFGALGDIHGDFASVRRIMQRHPDVPFWLCVGDVADAGGGYEPFDAPLYWIQGQQRELRSDCGRRPSAEPPLHPQRHG